MKVKSDSLAAESVKPATLAEPEPGEVTGAGNDPGDDQASGSGALADQPLSRGPSSGSANVEPLVFTETTPSGIIVEYQAQPKRLYRVNGVEVPSVTTVLGVLDKPALPWWGMKIGVQGVLELWNQGEIDSAIDWVERATVASLVITSEPVKPATLENVVDLLTKNKLTVNHVRDKAGDRGLAVHDVFEQWAAGYPNDLPIVWEEDLGDQKGYLDGLEKFIKAANPEPLAAEVMVGSVLHGFAGRYDIRLRLHEPMEVVVKALKKPKTETIPAGTYLFDLKTSSGVYPNTHFRQLEAYEEASVECGYEPTDARYVIHVKSDGTYQFVKSTADFEDFLAVLEVYQSNQRLK